LQRQRASAVVTLFKVIQGHQCWYQWKVYATCGVKVFVLELRENASSAALYSGRMMLLYGFGMLPCWKNGKNRWPHKR